VFVSCQSTQCLHGHPASSCFLDAGLVLSVSNFPVDFFRADDCVQLYAHLLHECAGRLAAVVVAAATRPLRTLPADGSTAAARTPGRAGKVEKEHVDEGEGSVPPARCARSRCSRRRGAFESAPRRAGAPAALRVVPPDGTAATDSWCPVPPGLLTRVARVIDPAGTAASPTPPPVGAAGGGGPVDRRLGGGRRAIGGGERGGGPLGGTAAQAQPPPRAP